MDMKGIYGSWNMNISSLNIALLYTMQRIYKKNIR